MRDRNDIVGTGLKHLFAGNTRVNDSGRAWRPSPTMTLIAHLNCVMSYFLPCPGQRGVVRKREGRYIPDHYNRESTMISQKRIKSLLMAGLPMLYHLADQTDSVKANFFLADYLKTDSSCSACFRKGKTEPAGDSGGM